MSVDIDGDGQITKASMSNAPTRAITPHSLHGSTETACSSYGLTMADSRYGDEEHCWLLHNSQRRLLRSLNHSEVELVESALAHAAQRATAPEDLSKPKAWDANIPLGQMEACDDGGFVKRADAQAVLFSALTAAKSAGDLGPESAITICRSMVLATDLTDKRGILHDAIRGIEAVKTNKQQSDHSHGDCT